MIAEPYIIFLSLEGVEFEIGICIKYGSVFSHACIVFLAFFVVFLECGKWSLFLFQIFVFK